MKGGPPDERTESGERARLATYRRGTLVKMALLLVLAAPMLYLSLFWETFFARNLETNPLALLPTARGPEPNVQVQLLLSEKIARAALVRISGGEPGEATDAAEQALIAAALESGLFVEAISLRDDAWIYDLLHELREMRLPLLFPIWLERQRHEYAARESGELEFPEFLAHAAVEALDRFLDRADISQWEEWIPGDPLLLVPAALENAAFAAGPEGGATTGDPTVWLWLEPQVFAEPYRGAVERFMEAQSGVHGIEATGAYAFAAASETMIKREIRMLAALTALVLGAVVLLFLRRPALLLVVAANIMVSFSGAALVTVAVFGKLHLVSFVFALLFGGLAADYTLHLLIKKETLGAGTFRQTLRAIRRPWFGIGCTTVLGFLVLLLLGLPTLRQVGLMVAVGVVLSLAFNLLVFTLFDDLSDGSTHRTTRFLQWRFPRALLAAIPAVGVILLLGGILRLPDIHFSEDIADLQPPLDWLAERDRVIRSDAGAAGLNHGLVHSGEDWDGAVHALRDLDRGAHWNLADLLPSRAEVQHAGEFLQEHSGWGETLSEALRQSGFDAAAFAPFFEQFQVYLEAIGSLTLADTLDAVESAMRGPARLLLIRENDTFHIVSLSDHAMPPGEIPDNAARLDVSGAINQILTQTRRHSMVAIAFALAALAVSPLVVFPWRLGLAVSGLSALALAFGLSVLLISSDVISLFHIAGLLVGSCLAMDYLYFAAAARPGERPVSIRLAAYSTFGVAAMLATGAIPAVSAISLAIAATVAGGYLAAEGFVGFMAWRRERP